MSFRHVHTQEDAEKLMQVGEAIYSDVWAAWMEPDGSISMSACDDMDNVKTYANIEDFWRWEGERPYGDDAWWNQ